jgi:hypothetical protein
VAIPAGSLSASVAVQTFADAAIENVETVTASIVAGPTYIVSNPATATVSIFDPPFDRWKAAHFTPAELADPQFHLADEDGDGSGNLIEYAAGTEPHVANPPVSPALVWSMAAMGLELRLYYNKVASDVQYEVQQSATLEPGGWTHAGVSAEFYEAASGLFYQSAPVSALEGAKYLRLRVIGP